MKLTRDAIVGGEFAQAIDGWHRGDVLRHLNALAAEVEALQAVDPGDREDLEHSRAEAEALLQAARAEANTIRAQAAEDAEQQMAQAQLAVKDLLDRVGSLNLGLEEARRAVEACGSDMARRLEQSFEPLVGAMRERANALDAEVNLMASGLAANARAAAAVRTPEPAVEPEAVEPEPEPETAKPEPKTSQPEPEAAEREPETAKPEAAEPEPAEPEAEPGTGLAPGDLDDAVAQLAADAEPEQAPRAREVQPTPASGDANDNGRSGQAGLERARLVALNMALGGASYEEAERRLREDLDVDEPGEILDAAYGRTGDD